MKKKTKTNGKKLFEIYQLCNNKCYLIDLKLKIKKKLVILFSYKNIFDIL